MSEQNQDSILYGIIGAPVMSMGYWAVIISCYMCGEKEMMHVIAIISQVVLYAILENVSYRRLKINSKLWGIILFLATVLLSAISTMCAAKMLNSEAVPLLVFHVAISGILFVYQILHGTVSEKHKVSILDSFVRKVKSLHINWVDGIVIASIILARVFVFEGVWLYDDCQIEIMNEPQWQQYTLAKHPYESVRRGDLYTTSYTVCEYIFMFDWDRSKCVKRLKEDLYDELDTFMNNTSCLDDYDVNEKTWEVTLYSDSMDTEENSEKLNKIYQYCCLIRRMEKGCFAGKPREVNVHSEK